MPLTGNVGSDIKELLHKYKKTGKIGDTRPKSMRKALAIASAIAYSHKRGKKKKGQKKVEGGMIGALEASK